MHESSPINIAPLLNKSRLVELTSSGPTLHDAAVQLLRTALKKNLPEHHIDPDNAMLMTPIWQQEGVVLITRSSHFESLTLALVRQAFNQTSANYIEGEHFVTLTPRAADPIHLAVDMDAITTLLNECAPALFIAFQQSQLDYWNALTKQLPRWQVFADTLQQALNVQSVNGWDADECRLARLVSQYPDKAARQAGVGALSNVRACLLDLDLTFELAESSKTQHLMLAGALVLSATLGSRELIVMYTITDGYESFGSMAQLGSVLAVRMGIELGGQTLKWRLYEPEESVFDAMVCALIGSQIDSIDALDPNTRSPLARLPMRQDQDNTISASENTRLEQLENAIPEWLRASSLEDIQTYGNCLFELGKLRSAADSEVFDSMDIPPIQTYAQKQMCDAIVASKANQSARTAAQLRLDELRISITESFEVDSLTLPDPSSVRVETLGEFALKNTAPYLATVAYVDGSPAPAWLTDAFVLSIANQINVGETYPQLIKRTLIDDPEQSRRHRLRYSRQLPSLLRMLALECKLKGEGNVDEVGYRQVCRLIESIQGGAPSSEWPVSIRPLAFMPRARLGSTPDTVTNMYVIGPQKGLKGPCLLYRPLLDHPLRQFPSEQNMLYAFYQSGELRDSILAWLPTPALSFDYAQYVFSSELPSLWTITELAFEPLIHLDLTASVDLADAPLQGDVFSTLFTHNSQAMAELADRQSTSNAERRWALLAESGWALFSVTTNFLSGPAGTAIWVWQSINQIQQALDAHERGDTIVQWSSIGDVLLTLGILLTQWVAARRIRLSHPQGAGPKRAVVHESPVITPISTEAVIIEHDPVLLDSPLPEPHLSALVPARPTRSSAGAQFLANIDQLKVAAPELAEGAQPNAQHVYVVGERHYAKVGTRWFLVSAEADEPAFVLDPKNPDIPSFGLRFDTTAGYWHWDLKLRLRGGAPGGRIAALQRERANRKASAWAALQHFIEQEAARKASLDEALAPLETGDANAVLSEEELTTYIAKADELASGYGQALDDLETWREAGGAGAFYQSQLMRLTVEQHRYYSGWMRMKLREYARIVAPQLSALERGDTRTRAVQIEVAKEAIAVSDEMIDRLARMQASLARLSGHSGITRKIAGNLERLMPSFSRHDLEANEIGMSIELSLRDAPDSDLARIRPLVAAIFDNAAEAGHALVERPRAVKPAGIQALDADQLTVMVDRLADAEQRLKELSASAAEQLEPIRFTRVQRLVGEFHQRARNRLLTLLPEPEELPVAAMARLEPVPSTSRMIGKVSKSRPRLVETPKTPSTKKPEAAEDVPVIKPPRAHAVKVPSLDDDETIANALALTVDLNGLLEHLRTDARLPWRVPADMQDLFDQQATRLEQAATQVDAVQERRHGDFPVGELSTELRQGAAKARREGIRVYGAMLMTRKPREAYLKWLHDHGQVEVVKDERGRIKTRQRKDYFQEYRIIDKTRQDRPLWVAHFHYDRLNDPDDRFTAAHLKFADSFLQQLPTQTRQQLENFDGVDNALRRIVNPQVRALFVKPAQPVSVQG
ncbi:dermonecrotic toxin domain-containing protein [Pseudomonas sp. NFX224]|uniref:dermonecrotic toxin domain-containing protein n=1 Tax=Pseudomonas sp. NFX224 TaxID=3402862 RepID=UPI003AFA0962